ncbi:hypothetical protein QR680_014247 [Steinernema hermaphroditum]|uniref:Serpin domain-containing protein n=1 Tax=Steinernema hermaphroditum TaxID=289476 RepID=A0AA39IAU3_9BILA|nr:hypothetical protein QR680_014247 [Steinernema hermaphroditum]
MTTTKPPSCGTPRTRRLEHSERTELPSARKQWVSWQTNFAMHCVRSEHNCLTSVSSPLALSAVLAMLFLAGDEKTRMEIAKVMKSPQGLAKEVMRCFQKVFAEFRNHSKIRDSPTDLLSKSPNPYQNCEFPGISAEHTKLDHFFYNAAVSFSRSGVGFFDDEDPSSAIVSSPSQRSEFNHPTGVSKLAPEVFSVRFDSPFVFAIVDCVTEAVLTIGSYSGPQGVPAEVLSRTYKKPRFCERRNANERKKCSVM